MTTRRVEFRDTDAAGIMHFSVFFTAMEAAEHEFLRSLGLSVMMHDAQGELGWPRVAARCDFQGTARFEEEITVEATVARLGTKSVSYDFRFLCGERLLATGQLTSVCCRKQPDETWRAVEIPSMFVEKLSPFAPGY